MDKKRLLQLVKSENDIDAIMMILSNHIDYGGPEGGMVSVNQFYKAAECLLEWWADKAPIVKIADLI